MRDELRRVLDVVLRDVRVSGAPVPGIQDDDWADDPLLASAMLVCDGSAVGIRVSLDLPEADRVAEAADQVQEWVIDELRGTAATNWPPCPDHPGSHPLRAEVRAGSARWVCPSHGMPFCPIGSLA
ncbi:hypothetical protein [Pengzhenrongella sp.]|uniref:hypothetical protein n=1 Tax=Pengzhenrongella sp. TaxID=2888820 RepID=UPI002F922A0A